MKKSTWILKDSNLYLSHWQHLEIESINSYHLESFEKFLFLITLLLFPTPPYSYRVSKQTPSDRVSVRPSCSPRRWPPCSPSPPAHWGPSRWGHWTPPSSPSRCCTRAAPEPSRKLFLPRYDSDPGLQPTICTHSLWKVLLICYCKVPVYFIYRTNM